MGIFFFVAGTYRVSSWLCILQLSLFLHNSNFFRQPSSLRVQRREQLERKTVFLVCEDRNFEGNFERRKTLEIDLVR